MNIKRQRELCAKFVGNVILGLKWLYKPDENMVQAAAVKKKWRELGIWYCLWWDSDYEIHHVRIGKKNKLWKTKSKVSEEATLTAAVAEMVQSGKEEK